jgi:hypothetical protein
MKKVYYKRLTAIKRSIKLIFILKNHLFYRNIRSPLSVIIAIPDTASHERRLETSYTVQLG